MRQIPIDEEKRAKDTLDVELGAVGVPFLGDEVLAVFGEDAADLVLVEAVVQPLLWHGFI